MRPFLVKPAAYVKGKIVLAGDKAIAHRAVMLAAISTPKTIIKNFPANQDCLSTVNAFRQLGVKIIYSADRTKSGSGKITVFGTGLFGLNEPKRPIFIGDSGTTLRLILGILAGQNFKTVLEAGASLSRRPMLRITAPLRTMGAEIDARRKLQGARLEEYPPITIRGGRLRPIIYHMPVASAQVKSAILFAGLYAKGASRVKEKIKTRDHTERMLKLFAADITARGNEIIIKPGDALVSPKEIYVPGDISSAAFFMVLAAIRPNSQVLIKNVGLNPTRRGIITVLKRMGGKIQVSGLRSQVSGAEPIGNILVKYSKLRGTRVKKQEIPGLIDELPVLMVAACFAEGKTIFEGVQELRVKETDRIKSMSENLSRMGADIRVKRIAKSEEIIINGVKELMGSPVKSFADHRTAMSMVVAGLAAKGNTKIDDIRCIDKSFPNFPEILKKILH